LIWGIEDLARCPLHGCDIASTCPHCGGEQTAHRKFANTLRCCRCREPIHGRGTRTKWPYSNTWVDLQIVDLVSTYCVPEAAIVDPTTLRQINEALLSTNASSLERKQIAQRFNAGGRPRLTTLLHLAAAQAVRLVDLINRPKEALSSNLIDTWSEFGDFPSQLKNVTTRYLGAAIGWFLKQEGLTYLPPLRYVLKELDISRTQALNTHLVMCRRYEERQEAGRSPAALDRMDRSFRTAINAVSTGGPLIRPGRYVGALTRLLVSEESLPLEDAEAVGRATRSYRRWRGSVMSRTHRSYAERHSQDLANVRKKSAAADERKNHSPPSSAVHSLVRQGELRLDGDTRRSSEALEDLPVCIGDESAVTTPRTD
jgi:hypothetical protein